MAQRDDTAGQSQSQGEREPNEDRVHWSRIAPERRPGPERPVAAAAVQIVPYPLAPQGRQSFDAIHLGFMTHTPRSAPAQSPQLMSQPAD
jgi:hypothetical protein